MKIHAIPQRSDEWFRVRLGKLTSSDAQIIYAKGKGSEESVQRRNLRMVLALERITGSPVSSFRKSWAMEQGTEKEPEARRLYQAVSGEWMEETGFCEHDTLAAGASLDAHTAWRSDLTCEGIAEIKCPEPSAHWEFVQQGQVPSKYVAQITHQAWITGAEWTDFVSWNPDFPEPIALKIVRVETRLLDLKGHEQAVKAFLVEVDSVEREIRERASITA